MSYSGELVVVSCWCGMRHAVPSELYADQQRRRDNGLHIDSIFCPLGHQWIVRGESKIEKLERDLCRERSAHDQTKAELRETELRRRAQRAATVKLKRRIARGACPCCNLRFDDLKLHMKDKHPEFVANKVTA